MKKVFLWLIIFGSFTSIAHAQSLDLLWEGQTYTPPFYQGGALWSGESVINFLAMPQDLGNPASLNYRWRKNGTILGTFSGIGRNTLDFKDTIFSKTQMVTVEILSSEDEVIAQANLNVTPIAPQIFIYENNPLLGFMFHREASGGYRVGESEVVFTAFPLFFSAPTRTAGSLHYSWRSSAGEDSTSDSVTYRIPEGAAGTATISAHATNDDTLRQTAEQSFLIQFGNENSN